MTFLVEGKTIVLPSGVVVSFDYPVQEAVEVRGAIVVCLDVPVNRKMNENVYAIDRQGALLWQIKPMRHLLESSRFVGVDKADERVRLFNVDGMVYDVDPLTGEIIGKYFGK